MPKHINWYKDQVKKAEYRKRQKRNNYFRNKHDVCSKDIYSEEDTKMILEHKITDRELAFRLGRTISAIQRKRWGLKSREKFECGMCHEFGNSRSFMENHKCK